MKTMPVVFIGHGSPMNAIDENEYTERLLALGKELPRPKAILCISAHWNTIGTWVTGMKNPNTIHDFRGFPDELFAIQYPAPGSPELAERIAKLVTDPKVQIETEAWGLDHGTWSVLKHMYPKADIPVVQLSIDLNQRGPYHFNLGSQLKALREEGVLILGSGNVVHNLSQIKWQPAAPPFDWNIEFDAWFKEKLAKRDFISLTSAYRDTKAGQLAVPSPDHYYPLLYVLGAADEKDQLKLEYEGLQNGSISMLSFSFN